MIGARDVDGARVVGGVIKMWVGLEVWMELEM